MDLDTYSTVYRKKVKCAIIAKNKQKPFLAIIAINCHFFIVSLLFIGSDIPISNVGFLK